MSKITLRVTKRELDHIQLGLFLAAECAKKSRKLTEEPDLVQYFKTITHERMDLHYRLREQLMAEIEHEELSNG